MLRLPAQRPRRLAEDVQRPSLNVSRRRGAGAHVHEPKVEPLALSHGVGLQELLYVFGCYFVLLGSRHGALLSKMRRLLVDPRRRQGDRNAW